MSRMAERRAKILRYIDEHNQDTLYFVNVYSPSKDITYLLDTDSIDLLVSEILSRSKNYGSYNPNMNYIETYPGRMRSSLDIWRHAKSIKPDIDIFTIMESIYGFRYDIYGHYCGNVKRAVFREPTFYSKGVPNFKCREYNIMFSTWRKLHE